MQEEAPKNNSKMLAYVAVIVVVLVVLAGGFYYFSKQHEATPSQQSQIQVSPTKAEDMKGMNMQNSNAPTQTQEQQQEITAGVATSSTEKTFHIVGGGFYFVPNNITVNKGDKVTFTLTNAGGFHDLVIDELNVKTPVIKTGENATVTFTAEKAGSFVYYCDVPGHRAKGMWGTLTVK